MQIQNQLPLSGNRQATPLQSTGSGVVIQLPGNLDSHDLRVALDPSSGSTMSEFSGFSSVDSIPPGKVPGSPPQSNFLTQVLSDEKCTNETDPGHPAATEKSVSQGSFGQLGGSRHLDKSRRSGNSGQSDELGQPSSTVHLDKPGHSVMPDIPVNSCSRVSPQVGLGPDSRVHPYTLTNPDMLTNPYGRVLPYSRLNSDSLLL